MKRILLWPCAGLLLLLAGAACGGLRGVESWDEPRYAHDLYVRALAADRLQQAERYDEALRIVDGILALEPRFVPALRLRQEHWRAHGHLRQAWAELRELEARIGTTPVTHYLHGRLLEDVREQHAHFAEGQARWPDSFWHRYAFGWSLLQLGDVERLLGVGWVVSAALDERVPWPPITILALRLTQDDRVSAVIGRQARQRLVARLETLYALHPHDGRIALALAGTSGLRVELVAQAIERGGATTQLLDVISELPRAQRDAMFHALQREEAIAARLLRAGAAIPLAELALRCGHVNQAEAWLERSATLAAAAGERSSRHGGGQFTSVPEDLLLGLLVDRGDYAEAGRLLQRELGHTHELLGSGAESSASVRLLEPDGERLLQPGSGAEAQELCTALVQAGMGELVLRLAPHYAGRFTDAADALEALAHEARGFARFYAAMLAVLAPVQSEDREKLGAGLAPVLEELRAISKRELGLDVVGAPRIVSFPLAGSFLDPFGPGLPEYFARHGRYLLFGQLLGEPVGALVGRRLAERILEDVPGLGLALPSREVLLQHKEFVSFERLDTSSVAGLAIWNHFILDARSARRWAQDVERRATRFRAERETASPPPPAAAALCFTRPGQVEWRIRAGLRARPGWDARRLLREVMRLLRLHERAHLVDAQRYLPVPEHLGSAFVLFVRAGFSFEQLLADLELRAECAALAFGAEPQLVLAHVAEFHSAALRGERSQHVQGFSELAQRLVRKWANDGAPGAIAPQQNLIAQLERMPDELARRYAQEILVEEDFRMPFEAILQQRTDER